jgi:hypothetical protein
MGEALLSQAEKIAILLKMEMLPNQPLFPLI